METKKNRWTVVHCGVLFCKSYIYVIPASSDFCSFGREPQSIVSSMANTLSLGESNNRVELLKDNASFFYFSQCRDSPSFSKGKYELIRNLINMFPKPLILLWSYLLLFFGQKVKSRRNCSTNTSSQNVPLRNGMDYFFLRCCLQYRNVVTSGVLGLS